MATSNLNINPTSSLVASNEIASHALPSLTGKALVKMFLKNLKERMKEDPKFKLVLLGGSIYFVTRVLKFDRLNVWPFSPIFDWCYNKITLPESCIMWGGEIEPDVHFGRLGYSRCLESDPHVLEKYGIPMNTEKCIRSGITYIPGEKYQQFDLNEFDSKVTPMTWTYGPLTDPTFITPTCWFNDMSGENREFELFQRSMRIFGYLPPDAYHDLYQHCKVMLLRTNQHLIRIGDPDDKMYIIVSGAVDVYSNGVGPHGDFVRLRTAMHGGQIFSLFSIIDAITVSTQLTSNKNNIL
ncbi:Neuropathy target esterase sws [Orchesella cincta]|uniref:Neuropathy target esterase sws n=1 Tax=Orchesella cincta TaxID=48709 RepID=A0A1D2NNK1_ORCCI|nr:Neuropathy target esterase sws [Orchesella cincta]